MEPDLAAFLARHSPRTRKSAVWAVESDFRPLAAARALALTAREQIYLVAAQGRGLR